MALSWKPKVLFVETTETSIRSHLAGQLSHLAAQGFEVVIAAADEGALSGFAASEKVRAIAVPLRRAPSLGSDLKGVLALLRLIKSERPDVLVYGTPKAALLSAVAGSWLRVSRRVYVVHGLRAEGAKGLARKCLMYLERMTAAASTHVVAVGPTLRLVFAQSARVPPARIEVLGAGSANGVDVRRFRPVDGHERRSLRTQLGIVESDFLFLFVGRLTRDKGVYELLEAFRVHRGNSAKSRLVMLGSMEEAGQAADNLSKRISDAPGVTWLGPANDVAPWLQAADVLVLPTYREGLPNVALEAAAAGLPVIASNATGVSDALGEQVALVPVRDVSALCRAMCHAQADPDALRRSGAGARSRVVALFEQSGVWDQWAAYYRRLVDSGNRTVGR